MVGRARRTYSVGVNGPVQVRKAELRAAHLARRHVRPAAESAAFASAISAGVLSLPELAGADTVAAYHSLPGEPATTALLEALSERVRTILLPVLRADRELDWAAYVRGAEQRGLGGTLEPAGPRLGLDAVAAAQVVICPGLAADLAGHRLGRGGGSYDRALARVSGAAGPTGLRVLLLYDDEVLVDVPTDAHDQPVDVLVTPTRVIRTGPPAG